jgi:hypothetical protein
MFDTVALKHVFIKPPNLDGLVERGWLERFNRKDGDYRYWIHKTPVKHAPRLTLSRTPDYIWHLRAEVSISAWLRGSNLILPGESDIREFLPKLSEYVTYHSGSQFCAESAKVVRVDCTKDLQLGKAEVIPTLKRLSLSQIPKMLRVCYDDKSVEFKNKGKKITKKIKFYSKLDEVISKMRTVQEREMATGILRVEVAHFSAVSIENLRKQQNAKDKSAKTLLTKNLSESVTTSTMKIFNLFQSSSEGKSDLEKLLHQYSSNQSMRLLGFITFLKTYGENFYQHEWLNFSRRSYFNHLSQCKKAGIYP